ncbi:MAG: DeoR/GlpR family DNA-binding transcription regulator [Lachnospiraceae bacterium]|jgi:DeoR/GlpR family transcriptional regulator of sugar metabolism|nr:DeoR/GlpR family DNA-binding transcription regulator [Lachnospiraceae bacterium]
MIAIERKRYIIQQLNEKGIVNLKEIARELGISEITVRRDFEKLEGEGKLRRVLGGATVDPGPDAALDDAELTMQGKKMVDVKEKERIAAYAAQLVEDGDSVFLDAGTSMIPLMRILEKRRVKIVTYNCLLIQGIRGAAAEIFLVGGQCRVHYSMNVGPIAQDVLKQFYFDKAFLGCTGADLAQGMVYTTEMESLLMKRIAIENAGSAYLLCNHQKIGRRGYLKMAETGAFTRIICDKAQGAGAKGHIPGQAGTLAPDVMAGDAGAGAVPTQGSDLYPENVVFV